MVDEYTPEQVKEIAGFMERYAQLQVDSRTIMSYMHSDLRVSDVRGYRGTLTAKLGSLRDRAMVFERDVPVSIRQGLEGAEYIQGAIQSATHDLTYKRVQLERGI
ncbi:MAG: hypothetical protein WCI72_06050 [archaeon]